MAFEEADRDGRTDVGGSRRAGGPPGAGPHDAETARVEMPDTDMAASGPPPTRVEERAAWLRRSPRQLRGRLWAMHNRIHTAGAPTLEPRHRHPRVDRGGGRIELGRGVCFRGLRFPVSLGVGATGVLRIGDYSLCNQGVNIYAAELIEIGANVQLGDLVTIMDTNFHEIEPGAGVVHKPVSIGDNVWIGVNAIVLPGVTIGRDTVVAAGSLVAKDLPEGVLAIGNPATVRRPLSHSDGWIRR